MEPIRENNTQSFFASLIFLNNILMFNKINYFSIESNFSPFLHLWSLSVEIHYYLLVGLVGYFCIFFKNKIPSYFLFLIFFIFLFIFIYQYQTNKLGSFYLVQNRIWEFLAGSIAFFLFKKKEKYLNLNLYIQNTLILISLFLIFFSFLNFDLLNDLFSRIIIVFSSSVLLIFISKKSVCYNILILKPVTFIGAISFSLYLWHNFIFVSYRLININETSVYEYMSLSILSIFLSFLSWKYIENPFRENEIIKKNLYIYFSIILTLIIFIFLSITKKDYLYLEKISRFQIKDSNLLHEKEFIYSTNSFQNFSQNNILVLGDSYARDVINILDKFNYNIDYNISYINLDIMCNDINQNKRLINNIRKSGTIILSYKFINLNCYNEDIIKLTNNNRKLIIIGTKNFGYNINAVLFNNIYKNKSINIGMSNDIFLQYQNEKKIINKKYYLDFMSLIKKNEDGIMIFDNNNNLISNDKYHLTIHGINYLGKNIINEINFLREKQ